MLMKKSNLLALFGAILLLFSLVNINALVETTHYVYQEKVLVQHYFEEEISNLELRVPKDYNKLDVGLDYSLESFEKYSLLKFNYGKNFSISYLTESMIDRSGDKHYFVYRNYLDESQKVKVVLPESAVLVEEGIIFPEPDLITTNGRSIILKWEEFNEGQILVDYEFIKESNWVFYSILAFLILGFTGYLLFQKFKPSRKKESLTKNLFEDEGKIVDYLFSKEKHEAWTKDILNNLNLSKVKLSRKLRSLEQKEIIKKIPYGNTNKIRLVK